MIRSRSPLLCLFTFALAISMVAGVGTQVAAQDTAKLSYKAELKWNIITPKETWSNVSGKLGIPHANGSGFDAYVEGQALMVDTTGNGKVNHKVKGVKGTAVLSAKNVDGKKFKYALRFKKQGAGWVFASSGVMKGKINGTMIRLLDLDNNGTFNTVGTDGMIIGNGSACSYVSKVVNLKGELYNFSANADGSQVTVTPYTGETGMLNVRKEFQSTGTLVSAVVSNEGGDYSFDLASAKKGMKVPTGKYVLSGGYLKRGGASVRMRQGRMKAIEVVKDQDAVLAWGAKLKAEFTYARQGTKITIEPSSLHYYGRAGVEFYNFLPETKSPKFLVKDKRTGRELDSGRFSGC